MLSKERKFLKLVDLYTQVVESGSTWGVQNDEDAVINTYAGRRRGHRWNCSDKYTFRHSAHTETLNKSVDLLGQTVDCSSSDEFVVELSEVNLTYPTVRTGTPIRKPNIRRVYW